MHSYSMGLLFKLHRIILKGVDGSIRFSEGMSKGRFAEINNPDSFEQNEEVIVFTREEFSWMFRSMMNQLIMLMILL